MQEPLSDRELRLIEDLIKDLEEYIKDKENKDETT